MNNFPKWLWDDWLTSIFWGWFCPYMLVTPKIRDQNILTSESGQGRDLPTRVGAQDWQMERSRVWMPSTQYFKAWWSHGDLYMQSVCLRYFFRGQQPEYLEGHGGPAKCVQRQHSSVHSLIFWDWLSAITAPSQQFARLQSTCLWRLSVIPPNLSLLKMTTFAWLGNLLLVDSHDVRFIDVSWDYWVRPAETTRGLSPGRNPVSCPSVARWSTAESWRRTAWPVPLW